MNLYLKTIVQQFQQRTSHSRTHSKNKIFYPSTHRFGGDKFSFFLPIIVLLFLPAFMHPVEAGKFGWTNASPSTTLGTPTTVTLLLDTEQVDASGADVVLQYDPNQLTIHSVNFAAPYLFSYNFSHIGTDTVTIRSTVVKSTEGYKGSGAYVHLTVFPKISASPTITVQCTQGETTESNIVSTSDGADVTVCSRNQTLTLTVSQATPTPTTRPSGSNQTTTPKPTAIPLPTTSAPSCTLPLAVTGFTATPESDTSLKLTWTGATGASFYSLQYGTTPGIYSYSIGNIGSSTQFVLKDLQKDQQYFLAVQGVNTCGAGTAGYTQSTRTTDPSFIPQAPDETVSSTEELITEDEPSLVLTLTPTPADTSGSFALPSIPWPAVGIALVMLAGFGIIVREQILSRKKKHMLHDPTESSPPEEK